MIACALVLAMAVPADDLASALREVDPKRLRATVEKLALFPTRNTVSAGIHAAADWLAGEYRTIDGVEVELMRYPVPKGRRVPEDVETVQLIATIRGKTDRIVLVGGHLDTINMAADADPRTARAPGANDDGSGVAMGLELARIAAKRRWNQTLKVVAFSGEEQGLLGSQALARRAKTEGWQLDAVLNSDIVGSSRNLQKRSDPKQIRVFSEESAAHGSRELARFVEWQVRRSVPGFGVKLVFRRDRFGRGGDHTSFTEAGYAAVRFTEVYEEYARQHNDRDLPEFVDYDYLARVTRANYATVAALASAGPAPTNVRVDRRQGHDTTLTWRPTPETKYRVYWRDTASPVWQAYRDVGAVERFTVVGVNKDDHVFAVGAVDGVPVEAK
ncbi:MAG: M20/M25/M40 family metallo-hydrolase [Fimbriimonadaceae bacterium]|nr:M20/M25/M40 family metallo-hydrolase [Fimbriimonadaceae bacterium]